MRSSLHRVPYTAALVALLLGGPLQAQFNPPVVTKVVPSDEGRVYFIDRGMDANIKVGDVLNVFRDLLVRSASGPKSMRIQLGTIIIISSEKGVSLGRFIPVEGLDEDPTIHMKTPVRDDLVIPKLKIDASVLFDPGAATLQVQVVQEELDKVVDFVRSFSPSKLMIEGHTDSDGDETANQVLSERRAETIMNYLIDNYEEIRPSMIAAKGYGERRPLVTNDTSENRALNRRIEIIVLE